MSTAAQRSLFSPRVPIDCIAYSHPISQTILDPKTSRRIFELARDQQDELDPPEDEEDEEVIEDDFTRPRTRDLEQLVDDDDDDEGEDERFQGLSGEEEREFVRRLLGCINFFLNWPTKQRTHRKSTRVTSRRSTRSTHPTLENVKLLQISFFPSSKAALVRPLSFVRLIDVRLSSLIPASFHILSVVQPTPV
jgi:hypothetical protein